MKLLIFVFICLLITSCASTEKKIQQLTAVDYHLLDSVKAKADTSYSKKYGTIKFANAFYFINKNDSTVCQVMKDTADSIRQVIITKKGKRSYFSEYYANGQQVAFFQFDSLGQYNDSAKYFYENGLLESSGKYKNGFKTGSWVNYNQQGIHVSTSQYDSNGQAVKTIMQQ
ncbi:hypothetical protein BH11BAC3_BH11BAC3_43290 [soil metagenome]